MLVKLFYHCELQGALDAGRTVPVEVRVGGGLLVTSNVLGFPTEKEIERFVDEGGEKRRVDDVVPVRGGRKDGFTTENEVHEGGSITPMSQVVWGVNSKTYDAFIKPSTTGADKPAGLIVGASAMKTLTFWLSCGWMERAAKA